MFHHLLGAGLLHHLLGAGLLLVFLVYSASERGRLQLLRRLPGGARLRTASLVVAALLLVANTLIVLAPAAPVAHDITSAATLLAVAAGAVTHVAALSVAKRQPSPRQRILAIGAHPDDLELACGGSLAKFSDAGYEIHALVMSTGKVGGDSSRRRSEARAGADFLGLSAVEVLDFPDTDLSTHGREMVAAIETRVKDFGPALVLTHSEHDQHQDHHAVHLATLRAARRHSSILCFESPSVTRKFNPSFYIDIENYVDIKIEAIKRHRDQAGKPYMGAERTRGTAAFRGSQAKTAFAEGFEPVRLLAGAPEALPALTELAVPAAGAPSLDAGVETSRPEKKVVSR